MSNEKKGQPANIVLKTSNLLQTWSNSSLRSLFPTDLYHDPVKENNRLNGKNRNGLPKKRKKLPR